MMEEVELVNGNTVSNKINYKSSKRPWIIRVDEKLSSLMAVCATDKSSHSKWRPLMKFLEISAHELVWMPVALICIIFSHDIITQNRLVNLIFVILLDSLCVLILKFMFRRPRPSHNKNDIFGSVVSLDDAYSFPSGHATIVVSIAAFLVNQYSLMHFVKVLVGLWASAVCASRVILGRHYLSDVCVGILIGVLVYYMLLYLWISKETCSYVLNSLHKIFHL